MKVYVGNLNTRTTEEEVRTLFSEYGRVSSVNIIIDFESGNSKGFGFVEMSEGTDAFTAIKKLHESEFMGNTIVVERGNDTPQASNDFLNKARAKKSSEANNTGRRR